MSEHEGGLLPPGFEDFVPYLDWALPTQSARSDKKVASSFEELQALYDLAMTDGRLEQALEYCDRYPIGELPEDVQRLFLITLSMAEVRPPIEQYGGMASEFAAPPSRLRMAEASERL